MFTTTKFTTTKETIKLISGLGNPGKKYEKTRHNIGFRVLDAIGGSVCSGTMGFKSRGCETLKWKESFGAAVTEVLLGDELRYLVKPLQYMNESGGPISKLLGYFKLSPQQLVVVHDDIDLPLGKLRIKQGGGSGGHNGLRSLEESLQSSEFIRLRIGVGRPDFSPMVSKETREKVTVDWVLSPFSPEEEKNIEELLIKSQEALIEICLNGVVLAQNRFNN